MSGPLILGEAPLTLEQVADVANENRSVELSSGARARVKSARESVERIVASGSLVYGVTTGFGALANVAIAREEIDRLQENLIISHAVGTGPLLPDPVVRATMLLRAASLAAGYSGIREETLELLLAMLNGGIHPVVPSQGSLGSSGDLAPLSHIASAMIGVGECRVGGETVSAIRALEEAGLNSVVLKAKEGLALINGTQVMSAILTLATLRAERLTRLADVAGAMTLEASRGVLGAFDERIHRLRPYRGQLACAANLRKLVEGSEILASGSGRTQDAYSIRCMPQVHGASRDAVDYIRAVLDVEINAVTDNPLVFPDRDEALSGGNFHGQPVAVAADVLGIAVAELGSISERRVFRLVDGGYEHLPIFVTESAGLNSGMMIPHHVSASLVSENKGLAHPNSVDSIPTSANQEDHNSMGTIAARTAEAIVTNVETVLTIEIMVAAQALEFAGERGGRKPGVGVRTAYRLIREVAPPLEGDRFLFPEVEALRTLVVSERFFHEVSEATGGLE